MTDEIKGLTVLGRKVDTPQTGRLESFEAPTDVISVTLVSDEVTANCPVTNQPDWYRVEIEYSPDGLCIESKSLKLYLWSFRDRGMFCEQMAQTICQHIVASIQPNWCWVTLTMAPRGGVSITARVVQGEKSSDSHQEA